MNSGVAVLGMMLHRYRRLYILFPAYLAALVALAQLPKIWVPEPVAGILCLPFAFGLLATVFGFVNVEADIASPASACSPWLLRMPVKTTTLAFWPIVAAALWSSGAWIVFATLYLRPRGIVAPIWWPAAMCTALALNLQALLWAPVRRGSVRLIVAITMTMSIGVFGFVAISSGWTAEQIVEVYAIVAAGSALGGWYGLARARTSPPTGLAKGASSAAIGEEVFIRKPRKPFRSPQTAQFWLEWRRQGRLLPMLTGLGLLAISLPLFFSHDMEFIGGPKNLKVNIWMQTAMPLIPWIPLLFASVIGLGARPADLRGADGVYHLYHATRPLSASDLYRSKILSITVGVLVTGLMTMLTMLAWLWIPAMTGDKEMPYVRIVFESFHWREWTIFVGMLITLTSWVWRNQTVGAFVDYIPSRKWATAYPYAVLITGALLFAMLGIKGQFLQEPRSVPDLSVALGFIIVAKLGLAIWFAVKLVAVRASLKADLIWAAARWVLVAGIASTTLGWIDWELPAKSLPVFFQHPVPELLGIVLVPLARPFAARMALEYGRHR